MLVGERRARFEPLPAGEEISGSCCAPNDVSSICCASLPGESTPPAFALFTDLRCSFPPARAAPVARPLAPGPLFPSFDADFGRDRLRDAGPSASLCEPSLSASESFISTSPAVPSTPPSSAAATRALDRERDRSGLPFFAFAVRPLAPTATAFVLFLPAT
jgi:hypothetical protein